MYEGGQGLLSMGEPVFLTRVDDQSSRPSSAHRLARWGKSSSSDAVLYLCSIKFRVNGQASDKRDASDEAPSDHIRRSLGHFCLEKVHSTHHTIATNPPNPIM